MKFIVRELTGEEPTVSITGVDHSFDYLDEAYAKQDDLKAQGTKSFIATQLGLGMWVEAAPVITAIKGEARKRLYDEWLPTHQGVDDGAFTDFLGSPEGIEAARLRRRVIVDEMAGRS